MTADDRADVRQAQADTGVFVAEQVVFYYVGGWAFKGAGFVLRPVLRPVGKYLAGRVGRYIAGRFVAEAAGEGLGGEWVMDMAIKNSHYLTEEGFFQFWAHYDAALAEGALELGLRIKDLMHGLGIAEGTIIQFNCCMGAEFAEQIALITGSPVLTFTGKIGFNGLGEVWLKESSEWVLKGTHLFPWWNL